jgi:hypothetical protein
MYILNIVQESGFGKKNQEKRRTEIRKVPERSGPAALSRAKTISSERTVIVQGIHFLFKPMSYKARLLSIKKPGKKPGAFL